MKKIGSEIKMSEDQLCKVFLDWVRDDGLAGWIQYYLDEGDTEKLNEIAKVYEQLKNVFGF